jgi:hypothetical protein
MIEDTELRQRAMEHLKDKRDFTAHVMAYVLVNVFLVAIWGITGAGFFWPMFPILGWGIGLFFHAWDVYSGPPTEAKIRHEMERMRPDR